MLQRWLNPGQKMAVGKPEYKEIIERDLVSKSAHCFLMLVKSLAPILLPFLSGCTLPVR